MRKLVVVALLLAALVTTGCDGPRQCTACQGPSGPPTPEELFLGPAKGGTQHTPGTPLNVAVSGRITFDRLAVTPAGLDSTPVVRPAAFVTVEAVTFTGVLATTTTNAVGDYAFTVNTVQSFFIRARAESGKDRVYFPGVAPFVYGYSSVWLTPLQSPQVVDLYARASVRHTLSGPFAILESMQNLRAAASGSFPGLGELDAFWVAGDPRVKDWKLLPDANTTETTATGPNSRPAMFLQGGSNNDASNTDHDEFDETVIAHEWASFLQLTESRDNNFGGPHAGEELIPTAAYSEGVVTAIGCALLGTNPYRDTLGMPLGTTSVQFEFDCESGVIPPAGDAYTNEFRVTRIVWDILDGGAGGPPDLDADPVAVDMADFLASFAKLKTRTGDYEVAWLASLFQQLIDDGLMTVAEADILAASQGAAFPPVGGPGAFPEPVVVGGPGLPAMLDAWAGTDPNPVLGPQANAVYRLTLAAPQTVDVQVMNLTAPYDASAHRLELSVHDMDRNILGLADGDSKDKALSLPLAAGTYLVRVQHRPDSQSKSAPVNLTLMVQ